MTHELIGQLNEIASVVIKHLFTASIQAAIFLTVIGLLAYVFRNKSATFRYTLWTLGLLKLLIPSWISFPSFLNSSKLEIVQRFYTYPGQIAVVEAGTAQTLSGSGFLFIAWLLIIFILSIIIFTKSLHFRRSLKNTAPLQRTYPGDIFNGISRLIARPEILTGTAIAMPFTRGILHPKIYLPAEAEEWLETELALVLRHELAHIKRWDMLVMQFQNISQILFFFHPLVWLANYRINLYREIACDDVSLAQSTSATTEYCKILLKHIDRVKRFQFAYALTNYFGQTKSSIMKRFQYILKQQKEDIMLKLSICQKALIALLVIFAIVISCAKKSTESAIKVSVAPGKLSKAADGKFVSYANAPSPIGGFDAIQKNLRYPELARKAGIEGKVLVHVFINTAGEVEDTKILISLGNNNGCDEAAVEAVKAVRWKPAMDKAGKPVSAWVAIPVLFRLAKDSQLSNIGQSIAQQTGDSTNFRPFDTLPTPVGGFAAIAKNLVYPEIARKAGIEGIVLVHLFINTAGEAKDAKILESLGDNGCDEAAIKALKKVEWQPAKLEGKPVSVWITVPVLFKLK